MNRRRPLDWLPALAWASLIFFLSHQSHPPGADLLPDYVAHFAEYAVLALALAWGASSGFRRPLCPGPALLLWGVATLYGLLDEVHQSFVPGREASLRDAAVDALAAAVVLLLLWWLARSGSGTNRVSGA